MLNNRTLNLKIPAQVYNDLQQNAKRNCISMAALVRMYCVAGIERDKDGLVTSCNQEPTDKVEKWFSELPGGSVAVES